jgi:hypothetical protein
VALRSVWVFMDHIPTKKVVGVFIAFSLPLHAHSYSPSHGVT